MLNLNIKTGLRFLSVACLLAVSSVSQAQIAAISDDFEGYGTAGVPVPADFTPWGGFSDNCGFPGGYSFVPSTTGPGISALSYDGIDNQYFNVYAQYENAPCHSGGGPNAQENISVFRALSFTSADTASGDTWVFTFEYREADIPPAGATEVGAFLRVFDPVYNVLYEAVLDTSGSSAWQTGKLLVTLDPAWVSGSVQIGFNNSVGQYEDSGMFYDDVDFSKALAADVDIITRNNGFLHFNHNGDGSNQDDTVPVVVLGSMMSAGDPIDLDTDDIDVATLRFGPGMAAHSALTPLFNRNEDNDGIDDARFRFKMSDVGYDKLACTETSGTITGELATTGETFVGSDTFLPKCNAGCH
jgi:hypothetical protein